MEYIELYKEACKAREKAYAPYSNFRVGASILLDNGCCVSGFNIENSSYGCCSCAERNALYNAMINEKNRNYVAIAIAGGYDDLDYCYPCGICRQVLSEFCNNDFKIIVGNDRDIKIMTLGELLPNNFRI